MSDEVLRNALKDFKRSVEITRDVRFQANLRLASRQRGSSYIVSLLSLYVIALSLIPNILKLEQSQNQILLACSVVLSVFVIFTSLLDGSQNFYHQGELLHQCARKIATINYELKNIDLEKDIESARGRLEELQRNYQSALDECPINHDNVDFYREIVHKPHLFAKEYPWSWQFPHRTWYRIKTFLLVNSWWFGHLLAGAIITYIVYRYVFTGAILITTGGGQ
ncbi:SLATT domain-containing protein [Methylobacterium sp. E-016]|uniref:SLATT domain-containing protein n=1 Tax=Methylobacterium sp. E-016 TaxID=2836556 RepID=UPI001FB9A668|nr:SLATT domain-containing protein [Methylobacterium sp. E-016]MCJ2077648.1 SLATT domain-containing protein [Methylobacterium sp. E-016]